MKNINTLVHDIYVLLAGEIRLDEELVTRFTHRLVEKMVDRLSAERRKPALSMSNFGKPCNRQLWYEVNLPAAREPLPPQARLKFLYGDVLEEFVIFLAEAAGHTVQGHQDTVVHAGVEGHRDVVIDGTLVDVKSANARSFEKFVRHTLPQDDPFGYTDQLDLYLEGSQDDPLVTNKDEAAFVAVDKELGNLVLDKHPRKGVDYTSKADAKRNMLAQNQPPARAFPDVEDGKSGNRKLGVACSYCSFKKTCWPELRTFMYSGGPRYLTKVARLPDVLEV